VSLIVDGGKIIAVDCREVGINFGEVCIPPARKPNPDERDRVERGFLQWRTEEMQRRYEKTQERLRRD
jgi:hypothetical protein